MTAIDVVTRFFRNMKQLERTGALPPPLAGYLCCIGSGLRDAESIVTFYNMPTMRSAIVSALRQLSKLGLTEGNTVDGWYEYRLTDEGKKLLATLFRQ